MAEELDIFSKIPDVNYTEPSDYTNAEEFEALCEARRSCRVYTDEEVPEEVMRKCLSLALLAPNSSNLQSWQFYWVRTPETKKRIVKACLSQPAARTAQELIVAVAHPEMWRKTAPLMVKKFEEEKELKVPKSALQYYKKLVPLAYNQGFLGTFGAAKKAYMFVRGLSQPTPRGPASVNDMKVWAHKTTALACQQLMLAFRAHGYDTCPMEGYDETLIRRAIKLPSGADPCMVISVGKRAENGIYGPRIRFDESLFIHEV
jgi:nitroreductase